MEPGVGNFFLCLAILIPIGIFLLVVRFREVAEKKEYLKQREELRKSQNEKSWKKFQIRQSKDTKDWGVHDWIDDLRGWDMNDLDPTQIYFIEQAVFKEDGYMCKFCGCTDRNNLQAVAHIYWTGELRNLRVRDRKHVGEYFTICKDCEFEKITPKNFERLVGKMFEKWGYEVKQTGGAGDEGIDLICTRSGGYERIVVQCKRYKGKVGTPVLRDFYGAMVSSGAKKGYIVTTGKFTGPALEWAKGKPFELIDREKLVNTLR